MELDRLPKNSSWFYLVLLCVILLVLALRVSLSASLRELGSAHFTVRKSRAPRRVQRTIKPETNLGFRAQRCVSFNHCEFRIVELREVEQCALRHAQARESGGCFFVRFIRRICRDIELRRSYVYRLCNPRCVRRLRSFDWNGHGFDRLGDRAMHADRQ